ALQWGGSFVPMFPGTQLSAVGGDAVMPSFVGPALFITRTGPNELAPPPEVQGMWATSGRKVWATVYQDIYHYDGTVWSSWLQPGGVEHGNVWGSGDDHVLIAGSYNSVPVEALLWDGTSFSDAGVTATAFGGTGEDDVWAIGDSIQHYDGGWSESRPSDGTFLRAVSARADGAAWVVGDGEILVWNGSEWTVQQSGLDPLAAVWATAGGVVACGAGGTVLAGDGTTWTAQTSGTTVPLTSVTGTSPTDVFAAGGSGGTLIHYDGIGWAPVRFPGTGTTTLLQLVGSELYIGGFNGGASGSLWQLHRDQPW
ncbi:MAG TPA: hypothetical protein VL172_08100, partial [Kofleriaceae bacterium]|nr:hypothetical protein [Kofleriaceae bacterium]